MTSTARDAGNALTVLDALTVPHSASPSAGGWAGASAGITVTADVDASWRQGTDSMGWQ
ncbi:hypothetical protein ABZ915_00065 [Streptomyces sp. NPDC046915]|uniref:hypothetical protein n=1 Tax=Streptomyces sp. NPDC046915 TaxID=3155257 RepID=UPI00340BF02D